jgi:hypothetical protein
MLKLSKSKKAQLLKIAKQFGRKYRACIQCKFANSEIYTSAHWQFTRNTKILSGKHPTKNMDMLSWKVFQRICLENMQTHIKCAIKRPFRFFKVKKTIYPSSYFELCQRLNSMPGMLLDYWVA